MGKHLANLLKELREKIDALKKVGASEPSLTNSIGVRIIGPPTSNMLQDIVNDLHQGRDWVNEFSNWQISDQRHALIYSPWATANQPWEQAYKELGKDSKSPFKIELNIASDGESIKAVVAELKLRVMLTFERILRHSPRIL